MHARIGRGLSAHCCQTMPLGVYELIGLTAARIVPKLNGSGMPRKVGLPPSLACNIQEPSTMILWHRIQVQCMLAGGYTAYPCLSCDPVALACKLNCKSPSYTSHGPSAVDQFGLLESAAQVWLCRQTKRVKAVGPVSSIDSVCIPG